MEPNTRYTMKKKKGKYLYTFEIIIKRKKDKAGKSKTYMELENAYKENEETGKRNEIY